MIKDWDAAHRAPPAVARIELPALAAIRDAEERFYLTMYLRSNIQKDQDEAMRRCEQLGVDYISARIEAQRS
jgi:hypothetical protein